MSVRDLAIVRLLMRRDAASVVVAVVLAFFISAFVISVSGWLSGYIFDTGRFGANGSFRDQVFQPFVALLFQLAILELVIRAYVALTAAGTKK